MTPYKLNKGARGWRGRLLPAFSLSFLLSVGCGVAEPQVQASNVFHQDLVDADIPPEWIIEGTPKARIKHLTDVPNGVMSPAIWECSAGKFHWHFGSDEIVHVLEGGVIVHDDDGSKRVLSAGDVGYFPAGTHSVWEVETSIRKLAIFADNKAPFALKVQRKLVGIFGSQ